MLLTPSTVGGSIAAGTLLCATLLLACGGDAATIPSEPSDLPDLIETEGAGDAESDGQIDAQPDVQADRSTDPDPDADLDPDAVRDPDTGAALEGT